MIMSHDYVIIIKEVISIIIIITIAVTILATEHSR